MDSLQVIMRLKPDSYTVDAVFAFYNTGPTTTAQIRFPNAGGAGYSPLPDTPAFMRFDLWANGKQTQVTDGKDAVSRVKASLQELVPMEWFGDPPEIVRSVDALLSPGIVNWLFAEVAFPARALTVIRLACEGIYAQLTDGGSEAGFCLETALKWKGAIRNASFTIDCTEIGGLERCDVRLHEYTREWSAQITKNTIRYEKSNFDRLERQKWISVSFR
jgi:hypothetical protein